MAAVVAAAVVVFQFAAKHFGDLRIFLESAVVTVSVTGGEGLGSDVFGNLFLGGEGVISVRTLSHTYYKACGLPRADSSCACRNSRHITSLSRGR